jgi:Protein of unknown function (DUF1207)
MSGRDAATRPWTEWRRPHWRGILVLAGLVFAARASAQESLPGQPERTFRSSGGVRVDIGVERPDVSDADILAALEQAAQQVREQMRTKTPPPADDVAPLTPAEPAAVASAACPGQAQVPGEHADFSGPHLSSQLLPATLLWQPPLANLREPRMFLIGNNLNDANTERTIDTEIGGTVALWRMWANDYPEFAFQQDFFALVLTRFSEGRTQVDEDYRFGVPFTFAWDGWEAKVSYEHTSSHLGDQFIQQNPGRTHNGLVDDEAVVGLAYRYRNALRLYGQYGYGFSFGSIDGDLPNRFDWGIEWSPQRPTGYRGQPFAAFDMELRQVQAYQPDTTIEVGWQWLSQATRPGMRLALTYYNGDSPYGQFFLDRERWVGVGVFLDY